MEDRRNACQLLFYESEEVQSEPVNRAEGPADE